MGAVAILALAVALVRRAAQRVHWVLTIDDGDLRIERHAGAATETIVVDVREGVRLGLGLTESAGHVDPCIALTTEAGRVTMTPGTSPPATLDRLAEFLRENDVVVIDALPPNPAPEAPRRNA
ncbi:MAG: hypothetical protein HS104_03235 [Polyangiaceae bacterium]|nr:hypothetical protein [Polyangiaceae bacterium]